MCIKLTWSKQIYIFLAQYWNKCLQSVNSSRNASESHLEQTAKWPIALTGLINRPGCKHKTTRWLSTKLVLAIKRKRRPTLVITKLAIVQLSWTSQVPPNHTTSKTLTLPLTDLGGTIRSDKIQCAILLMRFVIWSNS